MYNWIAFCIEYVQLAVCLVSNHEPFASSLGYGGHDFVRTLSGLRHFSFGSIRHNCAFFVDSLHHARQVKLKVVGSQIWVNDHGKSHNTVGHCFDDVTDSCGYSFRTLAGVFDDVVSNLGQERF